MGAKITSGDDITLPVTLKDGGSVYPVDSGATVEASLINPSSWTSILGPVQVLEAEPGSDWPNGVIVIKIPSATSDALSEHHKREVTAEVQVNDPTDGKTTWHISGILVVKGLIP